MKQKPTLFVGLYTEDPDAFRDGFEVNTSNYQRFPSPTANWGEVTGMFVYEVDRYRDKRFGRLRSWLHRRFGR